MQATLYPRRIRSYSCREKRLTSFQIELWEKEWPQYGLSVEPGVPIDFLSVFGREAPRVLEIGFGDGQSLLEMAKASPEKDFIGIEVYGRGVASLLARASKVGLKNLRMVKKEALEVLTQNIPAASLEVVQIFFADPWPKTRHHKRRLVQPSLLSLLSGKLKKGGILHLATDWAHYAQHMMLVAEQNDSFQNCVGEGLYSPRPTCRPLTKYEKRALVEGRKIFDLRFQNLG